MTNIEEEYDENLKLRLYSLKHELNGNYGIFINKNKRSAELIYADLQAVKNEIKRRKNKCQK